MDHATLQIIWFILIAVLWTGYLFLEGFDFGVGMLLPVLGRDEKERRVMINTIGPVWDGNEVWLLTAGGATFAAFPEWYATLFSGFYLALLVILLALIARIVSFEWRGKINDAALAERLPLGPRAGLLDPGRPVGRGVRQHRARRPARDRHGGQHPVRRDVLRPAQPVRPARRRHHRDDLPHPRRDLPGAQDRR